MLWLVTFGIPLISLTPEFIKHLNQLTPQLQNAIANQCRMSKVPQLDKINSRLVAQMNFENNCQSNYIGRTNPKVQIYVEDMDGQFVWTIQSDQATTRYDAATDYDMLIDQFLREMNWNFNRCCGDQILSFNSEIIFSFYLKQGTQLQFEHYKVYAGSKIGEKTVEKIKAAMVDGLEIMQVLKSCEAPQMK
eukprot:NODE_211_length_12764_cov_0.923727.p6 type:complete len:191 gc:universal NODE_211_length_12764_cov_0.923727:1318-1890(+)